jgi:putative chitinase
MLTQVMLVRAIPTMTPERAKVCLPLLQRAEKDAELTTVQRLATFLAVCADESAGLRFLETPLSMAGVDHDPDLSAELGNTTPGDGERFKDRGAIRITGRKMYADAGKALGIPLLEEPYLAAQHEHAVRIAAWRWKSLGLGPLADRNDLHGILLKLRGPGGAAGMQDMIDRQRVALVACSPDGARV